MFAPPPPATAVNVSLPQAHSTMRNSKVVRALPVRKAAAPGASHQYATTNKNGSIIQVPVPPAPHVLGVKGAQSVSTRPHVQPGGHKSNQMCMQQWHQGNTRKHLVETKRIRESVFWQVKGSNNQSRTLCHAQAAGLTHEQTAAQSRAPEAPVGWLLCPVLPALQQPPVHNCQRRSGPGV